MAIYYCPTPINRLGGPYLRIVSDQFSELERFFKDYDCSLALAPLEVVSGERKYRMGDKGDQTRLMSLMKKVDDYKIKLNFTFPDPGKDMHKRKTQIQITIPERQELFLIQKNIAEITPKYIPVLNLMMRKQYYKRKSGVGIPPDVEAWFEAEIRGKVIDLCRSGQIIDVPEHPDVLNLNAMLEKIDRGRRSDLKFSSHQEDESFELTGRFSLGAEKRAARLYEVLHGEAEEVEKPSVTDEEFQKWTGIKRQDLKVTKSWEEYQKNLPN